MIKSKFRITIPLCGLLLLSSCRTEELLHEVEQKEELSKKFITFTKKHENDVIDYGEGFKSLALRYDSIHKTNMTGRADIAKLEEELQTNNKMSFSKSNEVAYIDFNVRSQLMEEENGDKWMVFPRVKGKEVVDLVMAILSEEETLLSYYRISEESELYKENVNKFEEVYEKKQQKNWNVKNYSYVPYFWEREIEEVIIINPRPLPRKPDLPNTGSPAPPSGIGIGVGFDGNCGAFASCGGGGGGTSTPPPLPPPPDPPKPNPCDNIKKNVVNNPNMKEPLKKLVEKSKQSGEQGFKVKADGTVTDIIGGGAHSVNLGDTRGYRGAYHNHTPNGIKMHSIPDIIEIFKQIVVRDTTVDVSSVFTGMIGTEVCPSCEGGYKHYNYVVSFRGTEEEAKNLYQQYKNYDSKKDMVWYVAYAKKLYENPIYKDEQVQFLNTVGLEKLFFDSLKKKNLDANKFLLQRIDEKGNVSNISMENNASFFPNENPCN